MKYFVHVLHQDFDIPITKQSRSRRTKMSELDRPTGTDWNHKMSHGGLSPSMEAWNRDEVLSELVRHFRLSKGCDQ